MPQWISGQCRIHRLVGTTFVFRNMPRTARAGGSYAPSPARLVHPKHPAGDDGQVLVPIPTAIGQAKPASQNLPAPLTTRPCVGRVRSGLRYRLQPCCILIPVPGGCNRRPVVVLRTVTLADAQQFRTGRWSFHHWNRSVHIATCDHVRNLATAQ